MNLHPKELELLASLPQDPAYQLLVSKLQARIDEITDELQEADDLRTKDLLPYWRAFRSIYQDIILTPQSIGKQLIQEGKEQPLIENDPNVNRYLHGFYKQVQEAIEARKRAKESESKPFIE